MFETLEQASRYRELVTQQLRTSCQDIVTLDGGKISGRGITAGSSFQARPAALPYNARRRLLAQAPICAAACFQACPAAGSGAHMSMTGHTG